jgi:pyruvate/2-oxoglutarate dehydrogenase complex dihydrolipoamide acyltransferase (E2) component
VGRVGRNCERRTVTERQAEALEKLSQGIRESKQMVQQQTMKLAQDYFDDSVEALRGQIKENRATLEDLPDQVPGGREEAFQELFQELMDNYGAIEESLNEAQNNVANLDTERIRRQGEVDATDAARRHARELGIDLTEIEGTGSDGRITVDDVKRLAETAGEGQEPNASDAAKRRAEELGIDLSQVEGTGSGGLITVKDVTSLAGDGKGQAAEQAAQGVQDTAGQAAGQAQGAVGQVAGQAGQAVQGVQDTAGQAAGQAQGAARQAAGGAEEPRVTNAAKRKAEELGVDLSQVQGTGAGGLITIKDVVKS